MDDIMQRSRFDSMETLATFVVENRRGMSVEKLASAAGLVINDLRRLLLSRDFRLLCSQVMTLRVMDLDREERMVERFAQDVETAKTVWERRAAAEFLTLHGGMERARKTHVDHGGAVTVRFEFDRPDTLDWAPPDPLVGVVGRGADPALSAGRTLDIVPADPHEAPEEHLAPPAPRRRIVDVVAPGPDEEK